MSTLLQQLDFTPPMFSLESNYFWPVMDIGPAQDRATVILLLKILQPKVRNNIKIYPRESYYRYVMD